MHGLDGSSWVVATPDGDIYGDDLSNYTFVSWAANTAVPADMNGESYIFPAIDAATFRILRQRAREIARLLGSNVDVDNPVWVVADASSPRFGERVPEADLLDANKVVLKRTMGVWEDDGTEHMIRSMPAADVDNFKADAGGGGDLRVLSVSRDGVGRRNKELRAALAEMVQTDFDDFPLQGERVALEYLTSVRDGPGNLTTFHSEFMRLSGLNENSAVAHDHKCLVMALHFAVTYDQINAANSAMVEQLVRRLLQHEIAVERDPRHPDYAGLSVMLGQTTTATGGAEVTKFRTWLSSKQNERAQTMKQARLLREERAAVAKAKSKGGKGKGKGDGPPAEA